MYSARKEFVRLFWQITLTSNQEMHLEITFAASSGCSNMLQSLVGIKPISDSVCCKMLRMRVDRTPHSTCGMLKQTWWILHQPPLHSPLAVAEGDELSLTCLHRGAVAVVTLNPLQVVFARRRLSPRNTVDVFDHQHCQVLRILSRIAHRNHASHAVSNERNAGTSIQETSLTHSCTDICRELPWTKVTRGAKRGLSMAAEVQRNAGKATACQFISRPPPCATPRVQAVDEHKDRPLVA
mmetsp:Transcript_53349/g.155467  ORF Transcript_53349/g.155467 Transcript_53349/m.155467 type:complete len:239 (-) Transcript_53349:310-1026(-)